MSLGVALTLFLALVGLLASAAIARWNDSPRARHIFGIAAFALAFAAVAVVAMWALGALGMTKVQSIGMPVGAAIFFFSLLWPQIERFGGFRPQAPVEAPQQGPMPTASSLSITCEMGRQKKPDLFYIAWPSNGRLLLHFVDLPYQHGVAVETPNLDDAKYGTCTLYNDGANPILRVALPFAYSWVPYGQTTDVLLDQTERLTIPRIESQRHVVIRILNGAADRMLILTPAPQCSFENPGDSTRHECGLQNADISRRENWLNLFPGGHTGAPK